MSNDKLPKLIGFKFIESQEKFEAWQLTNSDYCVCTVIPHIQNMQIKTSEKYTSEQEVALSNGVFVTYRYDVKGGG